MKFKRVAWLTLAQAINSFGSSVSRKLCRRGGPAGLIERTDARWLIPSPRSCSREFGDHVHQPLGLIVPFILFTLTNPLLNTLFGVNIMKTTSNEEMGRITSFEFTVSDLGAVAGVIAMGSLPRLMPASYVFASFSVLVLLRWTLTHKVFAAERGVHAV